jgi:large subunit ribosomal protein L29
MKREDIRSLSAEELTARVAELRDEQFRLRFRSATETLEDPLRLRFVRREIARALTTLRDKQQGATATSATSKTSSSKTATKKTATTKTASKRAAAKKSAATKTAR